MVKERLRPFEIKWGEIPRKVDPKRNVLFQYDVYDVNVEMNKRSGDVYFVYFHQYLISEDHLSAFEYSLSKLNKGIHTRCHLDARGHFYVEIDNVEYSARTLLPWDKETRIVFLDEDAHANTFIRSQLHLLPTELHYLILDRQLSYEEQELKVRNWIHQILLSCK